MLPPSMEPLDIYIVYITQDVLKLKAELEKCVLTYLVINQIFHMIGLFEFLEFILGGFNTHFCI